MVMEQVCHTAGRYIGMHFHISHNSNNITFFSFFFLPSDDDDDDGGWLSAVW